MIVSDDFPQSNINFLCEALSILDPIDSSLLKCFRGGTAENAYGADHRRESLIVGQTLFIAVINLLSDYRNLKDAVDIIEKNVRNIQAAPLGVTRHDLGAAEIAGEGGGAGGQEAQVGSVVRVHPVAETGSQVHQRVAEGGHLP